MKRTTSAFAVLCFAMFAVPAASVAQSRNSVPDVLTPPPEATIDRGESVVRRFRAANSEHGQPRIAVFWNRVLSDDLKSSHEDFVRTQESAQNASTEEHESSNTQVGNTEYRQQDANSSREEEVTRGTRVQDAGARRGLKEAQEWELRAAFESMMLEGGALLVDRNLSMRTTSVGNREYDDAQQVEASALLGKADLLLEVLATVDSNTPTGMLFFVTAKRVANGGLVASFSTAAVRPSTSARHYVAGPGGFQRAQPPPVSLRDTGRELAIQTMYALVDGSGNFHESK